MDSAGNVWRGTAAGLNCLPGGASRLRRYTVADGLPRNSIMDILEDGTGNLWLGTSRGGCGPLSAMISGVLYDARG